MSVYGRDFAAMYNEGWGYWSQKLWPFLHQTVRQRCPRAESWLDLCCGTGQVLRLAGDSGYQVTGLDGSRHQLEHARRNAPQAKLIRSDVRDLDLGRRFDVITCLFDSLNYLLTVNDLRRAFARARRHLAPGGVFIFDMNTIAGYCTRWHLIWVHGRNGKRFLVSESTFDRKSGIGHAVFTGFVKEGRLYRRFEEDHVQRGYPVETLDRLLARAGFAFRKVDGHRLSRPRKASPRLIYICRHKP